MDQLSPRGVETPPVETGEVTSGEILTPVETPRPTEESQVESPKTEVPEMVIEELKDKNEEKAPITTQGLRSEIEPGDLELDIHTPEQAAFLLDKINQSSGNPD